MRTLLRAVMSVQAGNRVIRDGKIGAIMEQAMADLKPEYAYFTTVDGNRAAHFIFDLKDPTDIPRFAERFFQELDAEVTFQPVMNAEELKVGIGKLKR
jgi:hypothetical protein